MSVQVQEDDVLWVLSKESRSGAAVIRRTQLTCLLCVALNLWLESWLKMFGWWLKWTICLLGLITTSSVSPDDAPVDSGGGSGSGMLPTGKRGVRTCKYKYNAQVRFNTRFSPWKLRQIQKNFLSNARFTLQNADGSDSVYWSVPLIEQVS